MKNLSELRDSYTAERAGEFSSYLRLMLKHGKKPSADDLRFERNIPDAVLKAAVPAGSTDTIEPSAGLAAAFLTTLSTYSAFDAVRASSIRLPLNAPAIRVHSSAAAAYEVAEGAPKPISNFALTDALMARAKGLALVVLSKEALDGSPRLVETLISRELRRAVTSATDGTFLTAMATGAISVASGVSILNDIQALADAIDAGPDSSLVLAISPADARRLAMVEDSTGGQAFPGLTLRGGDLAGISIIPSANLPTTGSPAAPLAVMIDAARVITADDGLRLDVATHASVQLDDAPSTGPTPQISLWQLNLVGFKAERHFGFYRLEADAAATMAISW